MATKGVKAKLEPIAYQLYKRGWTLSAIAKQCDVSVTSLSRWKKDSHRPGQECDDWDLAAKSYSNRGDNLRLLFEEQEEHALSLPVSQRDNKVHLSVRTASANYHHWEDRQQAAAAALLAETTTEAVDIDKPAIFLEIVEWIAIKLKDIDPEGLKILARNFETLVIQFKIEQEKGEQ